MTDRHNLAPDSDAMNESASSSREKRVEYRNAPKNSNFSFRMNSPHLLKHSIEALCESEYNAAGLGAFLVDAEGFHLSTKVDDGTTGYLFLSSKSLDDFHCQIQSTQSVGVNLGDISERFSHLLADEDSVTIYKIGSAKLNFMIGVSPSRDFSVEIFDCGAVTAKLPRITLYCYAIFRSADLMQIIEDGCEKEGVQVGSVFIHDKKAEFQLIDEASWKEDFENFLVVGKPGETGKAWLEWGQIKTLKKACKLQTAFKVGFCSDPKTRVVFQFMLGKFGTFLIMTYPLSFFP